MLHLEVKHTEWTTAGRQVGESDMEGNANTIGIRSTRDATLNIATWVFRIEELFGGENGNVCGSNWVVLDDSCIAKETSDWDSVGLGNCESNDGSRKD